MFKINSYTDLKVAYKILEIAYESGRSQQVADLKREMRAHLRKLDIVRGNGPDD